MLLDFAVKIVFIFGLQSSHESIKVVSVEATPTSNVMNLFMCGHGWAGTLEVAGGLSMLVIVSNLLCFILPSAT